ncbi:hypothetical protein M011DRAFT_191503 [Sporormia fimetaria CBS 119925]|uniref:Uncharacterized protein n=1 Tax=Sporormia fimetaria CBS 119925 TaxID=1340428 RepID=A0A6A6VLL6_9PLEO|nr:hypothetical protein M011DRAFT_191503 [Sporormia fimetaria CBS 119925]
MKYFNYGPTWSLTRGASLTSPVLYGRNVEAYSSNQLSFPLLRLPAEIRNQIWSDVFEVGTLKINFNLKANFGDEFEDYTPRLAVLLVCRQIYAEARLLPFSLNTVMFANAEVLRSLYSDWLTPCQCSAIRCLSPEWRSNIFCEKFRTAEKCLPNLECVHIADWPMRK